MFYKTLHGNDLQNTTQKDRQYNNQQKQDKQ